jgi:hypothetical protein
MRGSTTVVRAGPWRFDRAAYVLHQVVAAGGLPPLRICMVLLEVHGWRQPTGCDDLVGSVDSRPSASARLAASILQIVVVIVKGKE